MKHDLNCLVPLTWNKRIRAQLRVANETDSASAIRRARDLLPGESLQGDGQQHRQQLTLAVDVLELSRQQHHGDVFDGDQSSAGRDAA